MLWNVHHNFSELKWDKWPILYDYQPKFNETGHNKCLEIFIENMIFMDPLIIWPGSSSLIKAVLALDPAVWSRIGFFAIGGTLPRRVCRFSMGSGREAGGQAFQTAAWHGGPVHSLRCGWSLFFMRLCEFTSTWLVSCGAFIHSAEAY